MRNLWRFMALYRRVIGWAALGVFLAFVTAMANIGLMGVAGWFIATMGLGGVTGAIVNYFTPAAIIRGLSITRTGGRYAERLATHDAALRVTAGFREWFYARLEKILPRHGGDVHSGDVLSRLRGDIDTLERFYLTVFVPVCVAALAVPVIAGFMAWLSPGLALMQVAALVFVGAVLPVAALRACREIHAGLMAATTALRVTMTDYMQGMDQLMVYDTQGAMAARLDDCAARIARLQRRLALYESLVQAMVLLAAQGVVLGVVLLGAGLVRAGDMAPAMLAALPLLAAACFDAVAPLAAGVPSAFAARLAADRIYEMADAADAGANKAGGAPGPHESLAFEHVSFGYERGVRVIADMSFHLARGDQLCIHGPSGAGKSTLVQLMTGLWDADGGRITINGGDIAGYEPAALRAQFAVAEQRPFFFAGSIRDNLLRACPGADDAAMMAACALAHIADDIAAMAQGLDTDIGENGLKLSGGQLRRLAVARAWLKDAPVLVLDEATEGLDAALALRMVRDVLDAARTAKRTVIMITHNAAVRALFARCLQMALPDSPPMPFAAEAPAERG